MALTNDSADAGSQRREALLRMLLGGADAARAAAFSLSGDEAWREIFHLAEQWSVASQLAARITALGIEPPAEPWRAFRRASIGTFAQTASRAARAAKVMAHLEQRGVRVAAFKGLASMARLYPRPAERSIKDADLLVPEQDLAATVAALSELGFTTAEGQSPEQVQALVAYLPNFSGNRAMSFKEPGGLEIDLHWSVGIAALPPEALLARAERLSLFGVDLSVVSAADAIVLTARHSLRENFAIDSICRDLFDARGTCALWATQGRLQPELDAAAAAGSLLPLLTLVRVLELLDPAAEGVSAVAASLRERLLQRDHAAAEGLVELFFAQLREGRLEKDLLYLTHARPLKLMVGGALRGWRKYRGLMQAMEESLDGEAQPLYTRAWHLLRSAKRMGPARMRSLRTLARLRFESKT